MPISDQQKQRIRAHLSQTTDVNVNGVLPKPPGPDPRRQRILEHVKKSTNQQ